MNEIKREKTLDFFLRKEDKERFLTARELEIVERIRLKYFTEKADVMRKMGIRSLQTTKKLSTPFVWPVLDKFLTIEHPTAAQVVRLYYALKFWDEDEQFDKIAKMSKFKYRTVLDALLDIYCHLRWDFFKEPA